MNDTEVFNKKRLSQHDYSKPGTYHLIFELGNHSSPLASGKGGVVRLSAYGEIFLTVLGMALQIFSCLRLDAMDIQPRYVELVVTILKWRKPLIFRFKSLYDHWRYRRTMTISAFAGYVKMNSGRSINSKRNDSGTHFWTLGFKDRILSDTNDIEKTCLRLRTRFARIRRRQNAVAVDEHPRTLTASLMAAIGKSIAAFSEIVPQGVAARTSRTDRPSPTVDTMLLGSVLFLNNSFLQPVEAAIPADMTIGETESALMKSSDFDPLIFRIGPGPIFLTVP